MPADGFAAAQQVYETLQSAWTNRQLDVCKETLPKLKLALAEMAYLPASDEGQRKKELVLARDALEVCAFVSLAFEDTAQFERYMRQLKVYYFDYENLPESPFLHELLGLDLLCMLSQNRIADFHMAIERLDTTLVSENAYIRFPISLEQYIMEGAFNKVQLHSESAPADSYHYFLQSLMHTIRLEVASCCEAAYDRLKISDLTGLLFADSDSVTQEIIRQHEDWVVDGDDVVFPEVIEHNRTVNPEDTMAKALGYARDLEAIV